MHITGQLDNGESQHVYFQAYNGEGPKDSALIGADGSFDITTVNRSLDFYRFYIDPTGQPVVLILDSTQQAVRITGDAQDLLATYEVSGSPDSEYMRDFFFSAQSFRQRMDSVDRIMMGISPDMDPMIKLGLNQGKQRLKEEYVEVMKQKALDHLDSPASLSIISSVDPREAMPEYEKVATAMESLIPESPFLKSMKKNMEQARLAIKQQEEQAKRLAHLNPGRPAPEIALNDPEGKEVKLSDLRGKYVLIDFWASWCGPCRRENPNVVKLYDRYRNKNFEILSVSLDSNKDRWVQAIEKDGLDWYHVSDLAKWNSVAARDYGVSSIPFTVLVDPDGNIIQTKLRGKSLEQKLEEILGA